ncbi:ImmA/IrrE family metallo-endopeptidase [Pedobacter agri]|uniref:ImmA/IrrE family metallo-endopeptidase n=1 Tax=Pedobacter agri TaxID=454586 RepID=UPI0029310912|nr:ImmA/IrrE family metallo-endopeptidase [Pedobacter agri]
MSIDREIIRLTDEFILANNLNNESVQIDLHILAKKAGATVIEHAFDDNISGVLAINGLSKTIGINKADGPQRKRFTIAHELGHLILHQDKGNLFMDSILFRKTGEGYTKREEKIEREANYFAANILMPEKRVKAKLKNFVSDFFDDSIIDDLAKDFGVSVSAMNYRLINLGIIKGY